MKDFIKAGLVFLGIQPTTVQANLPSFFTLSAKSIEGKEVPFSEYTGKVVMVVNVASRCGFTSQYKELQELYLKYKDKGFVILGFPSNDFGQQEPGTDQEIKSFCDLNYKVTFPMMTKGPVKGESLQPVYKYLTVDAGPGMGGAVLWNFEKFIINRRGQPIERFRSQTSPMSPKVVELVEKLLNESGTKK